MSRRGRPRASAGRPRSARYFALAIIEGPGFPARAEEGVRARAVAQCERPRRRPAHTRACAAGRACARRA
ncbi:hypothetical protein AQ837_03805 [Burkholderia pseudomallei]|nr:hypothetical protein BURPS305_5280 [Burkholderia pseudomallei 305]KIX34466.1 hypothetical protein SZ28_30370 [Burkholderia pseudomallei]KJR91671.1 hypothetical protein VP95_21890 [Burkholderia pseudomallei]KKI72860.1 hypothetical protein VU09_26535 [Burkholderia pseudomallei]KNA30772.1 hypothetical protein ADU20_30065 [Burkholderia pseudomallei]